MNKLNLVGKTFGRLTIVGSLQSNKYPNGTTHTAWECRCKCGKSVLVETQKLRSGHTKSCGCLRGQTIEKGVRAGMLVAISQVNGRVLCQCDCGKLHTVNQNNFRRAKSCGCEQYKRSGAHNNKVFPREYHAWSNMKTRCRWEKAHNYKNYGGRGITVCKEWASDFAQFLADMGPCKEGFTLERKDVNGNYEPKNCKWIPFSMQASNRRNTLFGTDGDRNKVTIKAISKDRGINYYTLRAAVKRGEDPFTFVPRGY